MRWGAKEQQNLTYGLQHHSRCCAENSLSGDKGGSRKVSKEADGSLDQGESDEDGESQILDVFKAKPTGSID